MQLLGPVVMSWNIFPTAAELLKGAIAAPFRQQNRSQPSGPSGRPVIVSFYGGKQYYYACAEKLKADCEKFGILFDIQEAPAVERSDWVSYCRYKIEFLAAMHSKHPQGILWIDVDSRILRDIDFAGGRSIDFGFFARGFSYIRDFDPTINPRMFSPAVLYFAPTPAARLFLSAACAIERNMLHDCATDDYFLQEAWLRIKVPLHVEIYPPTYINSGKLTNADAYIEIGHSGNVKTQKENVLQHKMPMLQTKRKKAVLEALAKEAEEERRTDAAEFYRKELTRCKGLASKISRALRRT